MVLLKSNFDGLLDLSFTITFGGRVTFLFSPMIHLICCTVNECSIPVSGFCAHLIYLPDS